MQRPTRRLGCCVVVLVCCDCLVSVSGSIFGGCDGMALLSAPLGSQQGGMLEVSGGGAGGHGLRRTAWNEGCNAVNTKHCIVEVCDKRG